MKWNGSLANPAPVSVDNVCLNNLWMPSGAWQRRDRGMQRGRGVAVGVAVPRLIHLNAAHKLPYIGAGRLTQAAGGGQPNSPSHLHCTSFPPSLSLTHCPCRTCPSWHLLTHSALWDILMYWSPALNDCPAAGKSCQRVNVTNKREWVKERERDRERKEERERECVGLTPSPCPNVTDIEWQPWPEALHYFKCFTRTTFRQRGDGDGRHVV